MRAEWLARSMNRGRQGRPSGRWEDAPEIAWGSEWTDVHQDISVLIEVAASGVLPSGVPALPVFPHVVLMTTSLLGSPTDAAGICPATGRDARWGVFHFADGSALQPPLCSEWGQARCDSNTIAGIGQQTSRHRPTLARLQPTTARPRANFAKIGASLANNGPELAPTTAKLGAIATGFGRSWPTLTNIGPDTSEFVIVLERVMSDAVQ